TGPYQRPIRPHLLDDSPGIVQVHASRYANPGQLPPGAVLVVGGGASGAQIAEELCGAGRKVFLSIGRHTRLPRRYRGRDLTWWTPTSSGTRWIVRTIRTPAPCCPTRLASPNRYDGWTFAPRASVR